MKFPSIVEYLDSFSGGGSFFRSLGSVSLEANEDGEPTYSSGNFGVVFKAQTFNGVRALKCFTRDQVGRERAYAAIGDGLPRSPYIVDYKYLPSEVLCAAGDGLLEYFPILSMEWMSGRTMGSVIALAAASGNCEMFNLLSKKFDTMAQWLLLQQFAHGDIKPDNIIVGDDGELKLVDYDGMFLPSMRGEKQREVGTAIFQHPLRPAMEFGKSIDHYSIAALSLTLRALSFDAGLFTRFASWSEGALFDPVQAVAGNSPFISLLSGTPLRDLALIECVKSARAEIENLSVALAEFSSFDKVHIQNTLHVHREGQRYGFADGLDVMRIAPIYDRAHEFAGSRAAVCQDDKWGYIDTKGKRLCALKFDNAWSFTPENLALVRYKGKYGFLGPDCRMAIAARYNYAAPFSEGLAVACVNGRYGYIDTSGKWAIEAKYDDAQSFHNGSSMVELDGKLFTVNREK